jgi:hypothetical protein
MGILTEVLDNMLKPLCNNLSSPVWRALKVIEIGPANRYDAGQYFCIGTKNFLLSLTFEIF